MPTMKPILLSLLLLSGFASANLALAAPHLAVQDQETATKDVVLAVTGMT